MPEFYEHPKTGKIHISTPAGGTGGGATSVFDAPATEADIAAHPREMMRFVHAKRAKADAEAAVVSQAAEIHKIEETAKATVAAVDEVLAHQSVPHGPGDAE